MAETEILTKTDYRKLVTDLRKILEEGKRRAAEALRRELVVTYWHVGQRITEENLTEQSGYKNAIFSDLSEELGIHEDTLERTVLFFEKYVEKDPGVLNLSWSHYRALLWVANDDARGFYEEQALKQGWNRDQLVEAIRRNAYHAMQSFTGSSLLCHAAHYTTLRNALRNVISARTRTSSPRRRRTSSFGAGAKRLILVDAVTLRIKIRSLIPPFFSTIASLSH